MQDLVEAVQIHSGLAAYLLAVILGFSMSRLRYVSAPLTLFISKLLVRLFYPSLILSTIPVQYSREGLLRDWLIPVLAALVVVIGHLWGKVLKPKSLSHQDHGTFQFMSAMPNYIFLPLPICEYLWGQEAVAILLFSTLGADLVMWGLAVPQLKGSRVNISNFINIPFIALIIAIILVFLDQGHTMKQFDAYQYLTEIGSGTVPLSLFLLGCHIGNIHLGRMIQDSHFRILLIRLVLVPSCIWFGLYFLDLAAMQTQVILLIAAMPVAIASVILSEMYRGNPKLAAEQILLSHLCCIPAIFFWLGFALPYLL